LLGGDYLRARLQTTTALELTGPGGSILAYQLAADAQGSAALTTSENTSYYESGLLTLFDTTNMSPPIYVKVLGGSAAPGTYTGSFKVRWSWSFCTQIGLAGLCAIGKRDQGAADATVNLTLTVADRPTDVVVRSDTKWDPNSETRSPKTIPGSKVRVTMTVTNTDIVALDADSLEIVYAIPGALRIALDGDSTGSGTVVQSMQGATPSTLSLTYSAPDDGGDDVDFSDGGVNWTASATPGDKTSQDTIRAVRFRPKGSMAPGSSFSISIPYSVK